MKPLIVVDSERRWPLTIPGTERVEAYRYLSDPEFASGPGRKVFNLCRSFRYQAAGYYVSLLAEARGHRPLPSVEVIEDLKQKSFVRFISQDMDELLQSSLKRIKSPEFELSIYFGRNVTAAHDRLALAIFNAFPAPLLRARFEFDKVWRLAGVRVIGLEDVPESHHDFLVAQAERYLKRVPRKGRTAAPRFELAILRDPDEKIPPSDEEALTLFRNAAEELGMRCDLIGKDAYGRLPEYDALFIRETTRVNHHTYRFARRAEAEGLIVIDDPKSIVRCTNKVFLAETMTRHRIATPKTLILSRENAAAGVRSLGFPCVIKKPDSAFSAGVVRIDAEEELAAALAIHFQGSDLLIAQEYVPTEFDWRIGVLGGRAIFACLYGMVPGHWQIVAHKADGYEAGSSATLAIEDVPKDVLKLALRAANLIGDGLYGVDLKVVKGKPVVIEINDNPNLDEGVEDRILGEELYRIVMRHFLERLEQRGTHKGPIDKAVIL